MKTRHWFFSDPHFGHGNILKYSRRICWLNPTERKLLDDRQAEWKVSRESVQAMNSKLIKNINDHVEPHDVLWFLGDWCFAPDHLYEKVAKGIREQINCQTIHAIWGNHDRPRLLKPLFASGEYACPISIDPDTGQYWLGQDELLEDKRSRRGQSIFLGHCAQAVWFSSHRKAWNLYGHSHRSAEYWLDKAMFGRKSTDVGVDNVAVLFGNKNPEDYRPASFEELQEFMSHKPGVAIDHHETRE